MGHGPLSFGTWRRRVAGAGHRPAGTHGINALLDTDLNDQAERCLACPAVPGAIGQRGPAPAVARLGRRLVRGVGTRLVRAGNLGAHGVQALARPSTECVCRFEIAVGHGYPSMRRTNRLADASITPLVGVKAVRLTMPSPSL